MTGSNDGTTFSFYLPGMNGTVLCRTFTGLYSTDRPCLANDSLAHSPRTRFMVGVSSNLNSVVEMTLDQFSNVAKLTSPFNIQLKVQCYYESTNIIRERYKNDARSYT